MKKVKQDQVFDINVNLPDGRNYPIKFSDELNDFGKEFNAVIKTKSNSKKCVLISNSVVGPLYKDIVLKSLKDNQWNASYVEIIDGEDHKNAETYVKLINDLLDMKVDRKTILIGLGGGVTTDIVGFAAATCLRGMDFVNIPTSLLAAVDASIGGKTGVNTVHGKNLLGAFWQPKMVFISPQVFKTLTDAEYRCGLGEVVKHAVLEEEEERIANKVNETFFEFLVNNSEKISIRESLALKYTIKRCCQIKAFVVQADERESGKRAILNLGHTVAHAIEFVSGYGAIRHGEAVAIGTIAEAQLAVKNFQATKDLPQRIAKLTKVLGLPYYVEGLDEAELLKAVFSDKKMEGTEITITIPREIGKVDLIKVNPTDLAFAFSCLAKNKSLV